MGGRGASSASSASIPNGMSRESYERYKSQGFSQSEIEKIWRDTQAVRKRELRKERTEQEVTSTTYERAQRRLQRDIDNWFRR